MPVLLYKDMTAGLTPWERWKRFAQKAASVQSNALLFVVYYVVFLPAASLQRLVNDPFRRPPGQSDWRDRQVPSPDLASARRQS
jgi:hypothetical protein